ncbi:hypothetical protein Tco_0146533 [Tanacetum coccineum]
MLLLGGERVSSIILSSCRGSSTCSKEKQTNDSTAEATTTKEVPANAQGVQIPFVIDDTPFEQYTTDLFSSGSSEFSLTLPPKVSDKGRGIAQTFKDDQLEQLLSLMEEGGSAPKLSNLHQFRTDSEGPLTLEEAKLQMQEIKRLAELKVEKEKSEKKIKKVLTPEHRKAQEEEFATYEAKRANMLEEYNHYITFREDPLPITKFSYRVNNSTKEGTMRITRNNQPLNLKVYEKFVLKKLGFTEWLEEKKEFHLATTAQLIRVRNAIKTDSVEAREMFDKMIYVTKARNDVVEARKIVQDNLVSNEGLVKSIALASNIRRIQVKDIIKEVEDYLKTYSSDGMDIS